MEDNGNKETNRMININKEALEEALFVIASIVERCENAQTKFREGTSQHTLLKNRIRALYLSKGLVEAELLRMGGRLSAAFCEEAGKCDTRQLRNTGRRLFHGGTKISGSSYCFYNQ